MGCLSEDFHGLSILDTSGRRLCVARGCLCKPSLHWQGIAIPPLQLLQQQQQQCLWVSYYKRLACRLRKGIVQSVLHQISDPWF